MSAPSHLRSSSSDSDSDLSFEVLPESHPDYDIISESDASDCEEQIATGAVSVEEVEKMCSGLESRINALSERLDENDTSMKKDEKIIKKQENELASLMAANEALKRAQEQLKDTVSRRDVQIAEKEKEKAEVLRNLDQVKKQKDEACAGLKQAEEMRSEVNELRTRCQRMAKNSMEVGWKLEDKLNHLEARNKELGEEKRKDLEKIESLTSEKDALTEKLKNAEEMRTSEVNELQTMYQELTKQVNEKQIKDMVDYLFETHGLKHRLAEKEAENEKNLREISNLKNERNELIEKLHQECDLMEELSNEMMVLTADLNEMQAEHQRVTLENMELSEQKATLEQETLKNLAVIQDLKDRRDQAETAKNSLAKELQSLGIMFFEKSNECSELEDSIEILKKSKADCESKFLALDHRNVQLEARIAERDEEKQGDMEEIQNLRKFKNELLEEMKGKEYHANEQIGELTRRNLALEEQIRVGDEVAENLKKESAQEKKRNEQELRVMAEERQQFEEKYKKYKQIAHSYKKKCEELSGQSQLDASRSIGNRAKFEKQINGRWILASSMKSDGFSLPEKYHNWNKGHLVCELKDNQFTTSIHIGSVPTNTEHFVLETAACFMKNNTLLIMDYKPAPFGMVACHYFKNGLLKIKVTLKCETGIYTFVKAE